MFGINRMLPFFLFFLDLRPTPGDVPMRGLLRWGIGAAAPALAGSLLQGGVAARALHFQNQIPDLGRRE